MNNSFTIDKIESRHDPEENLLSSLASHRKIVQEVKNEIIKEKDVIIKEHQL